ncbi:MAG: cyclic pyranopterin monophosphate synthase MoaC [Pseudomonadota bacterium]
MEFTHMDKNGNAMMVDISNKKKVKRVAKAKGKIVLAASTLEKLKSKLLKKGDALSVAKIAGILGAKKTSDLIPLCHNIEIDKIDLSFELVSDGVEIYSEAICTDKTGIEMEALTAVSVAALTIYDMCKAVDKEMKIGGIELVEKTKEEK